MNKQPTKYTMEYITTGVHSSKEEEIKLGLVNKKMFHREGIFCKLSFENL